MKLFKFIANGHYMNSYGFVVAENITRAIELAEIELASFGVGQKLTESHVKEVTLDTEKAIVLFNGDY